MAIVSMRKTASDDYERIREAVFSVIRDLGGLEDIIRPGFRVLVKPNFVAVPEYRLSGAVTRWEVCKAVCEAVSAVGGKPFIAESASVGADTEDVILFCGYQKLREEGIEVIDLKSGREMPCVLPVPGGALYDAIPSWEAVLQADAVISVPVMKVHDQLGITVGIKNLKGLVRDEGKKEFHRRGVTDAVCDLLSAVRPVLCIVDATYCLEGIGPVFGDTRHVGLIVGSKDVVACDTVCGELMDFRPWEVEITAEAARRGLGTADPAAIEIIGEDPLRYCAHFSRSAETGIEGLPEDFRVLYAEGTCSGCRNTLIGTLTDMKAAGLLPGLAGLTLLCGPCDRSMLPEGIDPDRTFCVGSCAVRSLGNAEELPSDPGCPPLRLQNLWRLAKSRL